jgi:hypothetical protein
MNSTIPSAPERKQQAAPDGLLRFIPLLSLLAALLLVPTSRAETTSASGAEEITSLPATITLPGTYYLRQNLQVNMTAPGAALLIQADDVTIDLNGHTITNLAAGPQVWTEGIHGRNRKNVIVRNGTVVGFQIGVDFDSDSLTDSALSSGHLVEDVHVTKCNCFGIVLTGGNGTVRRCRLDKIGGNSLRNDYWPSAIAIVGPNQRVLDCDIGETLVNAWGGGTVGILCLNTTDAILEGNRVCQVTHAIAYNGASTFKYRNTLTGFGMTIPYWVGSGGVDAGGNN